MHQVVLALPWDKSILFLFSLKGRGANFGLKQIKQIDDKWIQFYIHFNRKLSSDVSSVSHLLPYRRKGRRGPETGMGSREVKSNRYVLESDASNWEWPTNKISQKDLHNLIDIMLEIAVKFFFEHFILILGGFNFLQASGGQIGARLTMCVARLVLQQ